jgi:hypothetical protein
MTLDPTRQRQPLQRPQRRYCGAFHLRYRIHLASPIVLLMIANSTIVAIAEGSPLGLAMHAKVKLPVFATLLADHLEMAERPIRRSKAPTKSRVAPHEGREPPRPHSPP